MSYNHCDICGREFTTSRRTQKPADPPGTRSPEPDGPLRIQKGRKRCSVECSREAELRWQRESQRRRRAAAR